MASCNPYTLDGHVMHGTCTTNDKQTRTSSLDLNQCIGNAFGRLVWQAHGDFGSSCKCSLSVSSLYCFCHSGHGNDFPTSLDLNTNVGNDNGVLTCYIF
ncbi:Cyanovirin-N [Cadophora sp. MPI-SDFR-AT-0126]|nr:Cyanovirin-N [Leotiomycetes sp. MPI-SDFR-AT-0126]